MSKLTTYIHSTDMLESFLLRYKDFVGSDGEKPRTNSPSCPNTLSNSAINHL